MSTGKPTTTTRIAAQMENHSYLLSLLALLCLLFAVNFFVGPGGSGLGGTGKSGGESGFGGTGNLPDGGPGFSLGATDIHYDKDVNDIQEMDMSGPSPKAGLVNPEENVDESPYFDIAAIRLSPVPEAMKATRPDKSRVDTLIAEISLPELATTSGHAPGLNNQPINQDTSLGSPDSSFLVTDADILNSLLLAEASVSLHSELNAMADSSAILAMEDSVDDDTDKAVRQRLALPARPERPDRINVPGRVNVIQRIDIPAAPPVRPMRTMSTLLSK